jgi:hypothetical protein
MSKGPRWRDSDFDYRDDEPSTPPRPRIDVAKLKRKLISKPSQARIPGKPRAPILHYNKRGKPMDGALIWFKYPIDD